MLIIFVLVKLILTMLALIMKRFFLCTKYLILSIMHCMFFSKDIYIYKDTLHKYGGGKNIKKVVVRDN